MTLLGELRRALERDELVLHHQPASTCAPARSCGAEALVRWQHPTHGLMPPGRVHRARRGVGHDPAADPVGRPHARSAHGRCRGRTARAPTGRRRRQPLGAQPVRPRPDPLAGRSCWRRPASRRTLLTLEITESELMDDPLLAVEVLAAAERPRRRTRASTTSARVLVAGVPARTCRSTRSRSTARSSAACARPTRPT